MAISTLQFVELEHTHRIRTGRLQDDVRFARTSLFNHLASLFGDDLSCLFIRRARH